MPTPDQVDFVYEGAPIEQNQTPAELYMDDGDVIEVHELVPEDMRSTLADAGSTPGSRKNDPSTPGAYANLHH